MMMEDKDLSRHMHLPHPGIGAMPRTMMLPDAEPPIVEPKPGDPCRNLWESIGWYEGVALDPQMKQGTNNIVIAFNLDGMSPFKRGGLSIHPLVFQVLNLPENIRLRHEFMILAGVIPGPRQPKRFNTYLALLVNELRRLYKNGFLYIDPYTRLPRRSFVKLLFTACDYPGHGYVNCMQHQAAISGCQKCDLSGYHAASLQRVLYAEFESLYVPGKVRPNKLTKEIYEARAKEFEKLEADYKARRMTETNFKNLASARCRQVKGKSELTRLSYFDVVEHTPPDLMHIISGVLHGHIIPMIKGDRLKNYVDPLPETQPVASRAESTSKSTSKSASKRKKRKSTRDLDDEQDDEDEASTSTSKSSKATSKRPAKKKRKSTRADDDDDEDSEYQDDDESGDSEYQDGDEQQDDPRHDGASTVPYDIHSVAPSSAAAAAANVAPAAAASSSVGLFSVDEDEPMDEYTPATTTRVSASRLAQTAGDSLDAARAIPAAATPLTAKQRDVAKKAAEQAQKHAEINEDRAKHRTFQELYRVSEKELNRIEREGYNMIQGPGNIAPLTKNPLTIPSTMTMDSWLVFTKVYGKYLFKLMYPDPAKASQQERALKALCNLLDLMSLCALLSHTKETKARIAELVKVVAKHFQEDFPDSEHAIVVHNLLHHIPEAIERWGPAVGFWCFAFERSVTRDVMIDPRRHRRQSHIKFCACVPAQDARQVESSDQEQEASRRHTHQALPNEHRNVALL